MRTRLCTGVPEDADIGVLGIPSDEGSGWLPGARLGPRSMREMSMRFASGIGVGGGFWDIDEDREYLTEELNSGRIVDCGDVDIVYTNPEKTWENITARVGQLLHAGTMPLILGGDHAVTFPVARAFQQPLTVVHFDAHMDYQPFTHGIIHSHGNPMRLVHDLPTVEQIIQVGIRSFRTAKQDYLDSIHDGNTVISSRTLKQQGTEPLTRQLRHATAVYVSVDIDVLDPPLVPGTSAPEPSGLSYDELRQALFAVAQNANVVGFDIVEVNPVLDIPSRLTAFTAVQLAVEFLARCRTHPTAASEPRPAPALDAAHH
jgi:agmatinase